MNEKCYEGCCIGRCVLTPPTPLKEIERLREENARLEADNAALAARIKPHLEENHKREINRLTGIIRSHEERLAEKSGTIGQLDANLADANSLIDFQARKLKWLEERDAGGKEANALLRNEIGKLQVRIHDLEMDKSELLSRTRAAEGQLGIYSRGYDEVKRELEEARSAHKAAEARATKASMRLRQLETSIRVAANSLKEIAGDS